MPTYNYYYTTTYRKLGLKNIAVATSFIFWHYFWLPYVSTKIGRERISKRING